MIVLRDNILVKRMSKEQLGNIVLPEMVQDDWKRGKVISIGPAVEGDIRVDDVVIFPPSMRGEYPSVGDDDTIIIPEGLIWAIEDRIKETK